MKTTIAALLVVTALYLAASICFLRLPSTRNIETIVSRSPEIEHLQTSLDGMNADLSALKVRLNRVNTDMLDRDAAPKLAAIDRQFSAVDRKLNDAVRTEHEDKADSDAQLHKLQTVFSDFDLRLSKASDEQDALEVQVASLTTAMSTQSRGVSQTVAVPQHLRDRAHHAIHSLRRERLVLLN